MLMRVAASLVCGLLAGVLMPAHGAELVVGQVAPLDDPASTGNQLRQGIALCFDAINRRGGVHGAVRGRVSPARSHARTAVGRG